jgi:membrane protein DedA with SNARE-associated domain
VETLEVVLAYLGTFALAVLTAIGVPGPGDGALVAAGIAAAEGYLAVVKVIAVGFLGGVAGCEIGYRLGSAHGRRLLEDPGPFLKIRQRTLANGEALLLKFPRIASFIVPSLVCGIFRVPRLTFFIFSTLSRLWWALSTTLLAYFLGEEATRLLRKATGIPGFWIIAVLALLTALGWWLWSQRAPARSENPQAL